MNIQILKYILLHTHRLATTKLESFMDKISSAIKLMDTSLIFLTTKLNEVCDRQEKMEASMKLLLLRKNSHSDAICSTPAFIENEKQPWWCSDSILMATETRPPTTIPLHITLLLNQTTTSDTHPATNLPISSTSPHTLSVSDSTVVDYLTPNKLIEIRTGSSSKITLLL